MAADMRSLKIMVSDAFKLSGLDIKIDAKRFLAECLLKSNSPTSYREWLEKIIQALLNQSLQSCQIDLDTLQVAMKECTHSGQDSEHVFTLINAYDVPKLDYVVERKKFVPKPPGESRSLFGDADEKSAFYRRRYTLIHQRLLRHKMFAPLTMLGTTDDQKIELRNVESLLGASTFDEQEVIVFGMLTQLKEDKFFLEDPTGYIQLDLTQGPKYYVPGLYTENCMVLVQAICRDKILTVKAICHPPGEKAEMTRTYFGDVNFFGGSSGAKTSTKLQRIEAENASGIFVILSDVWLDDQTVLDKLERLFAGYADYPPICFILCGHFLSQPYGFQQFQRLADGFAKLAAMLAQYPSLVADSQFVFVPGLQDPTLCDILPRPPLPDAITAPLRSKGWNCRFASNPCRLQYCTQEIVICREDLMHKMCRNTIHMPSTQREIPMHFAHSILCQSHLTPLPIHVCPVYWSFDHALSLYPVPDLLIIADKYDPYTVSEYGCTVINPGSFLKSSFAFKVYIPATRVVEDSILPANVQ